MMANPWLDPSSLPEVLETMASQLRQHFSRRSIHNPLMVGIHTGGVWVAQRLHALLELPEPLGTLDIAFYRDDFTRIGLNPVVRPSDLPVSPEDRHVLLVDDVLYTGRTIRAALNQIFDYARPASVCLATLVDREGRELPIEPRVTGLRVDLPSSQHIKLASPDPLVLTIQTGAPG